MLVEVASASVLREQQHHTAIIDASLARMQLPVARMQLPVARVHIVSRCPSACIAPPTWRCCPLVAVSWLNTEKMRPTNPSSSIWYRA
jgi:hypothetical protein